MRDVFALGQLRNWSFSGLAFKVRLRVDTPVFAIKRKIVERHGRLSKLTLYKDAETPDCEILNDRLTLAELGILGRPLHDPPEVVILHYDFKPFAHDEPVLLAGACPTQKGSLEARRKEKEGWRRKEGRDGEG